MGRRIASESKQTVRGGPKPAKVGLHRRLHDVGHLRILEQGQSQIPTLARGGGGGRGLHWLMHKMYSKNVRSKIPCTKLNAFSTGRICSREEKNKFWQCEKTRREKVTSLLTHVIYFNFFPRHERMRWNWGLLYQWHVYKHYWWIEMRVYNWIYPESFWRQVYW